jgi:hypothetical protein
MRNEKFAKRLGATRHAYQTATARAFVPDRKNLKFSKKISKKSELFAKKCVYIGEGAKKPRKRMGKKTAQAQYLTVFFVYVIMKKTEIAQRRVTDEQARRIIEKHSGCHTVSDFERLDVATRNKYLKILKQEGLSIRQISRLTGVSFGIVRNV